MHNWHCLLLALLAFLQPIASFTERSLVDGRELCCDRSGLHDSRLSYGTFRFNKAREDRLLNYRADIREDRRYEVKKDYPVLTHLADRRLVEHRSERKGSRISTAINTQFIRNGNQRIRNTNDQRSPATRATEARDRLMLDTHSRVFNREVRDRDNARMQPSRTNEARLSQHNIRDVRMSRDSNTVRFNFRDRHVFLSDTKRESHRNSEITNEFRRVHSRETRDLLQRARPDVARSDIFRDRQARERMDRQYASMSQLESRLQLDNNRVRQSLERRVRDRETVTNKKRIPLASSRSAERVHDFRQERRLNIREDNREGRPNFDTRLTKVERRSTQQRQERSESKERNLTTRMEFRDRVTGERQYRRESVDRTRKMKNMVTQLERVDSQRDFKPDMTVLLNRASVNRRLESRRTVDRVVVRQRDNIVASRRDRYLFDSLKIRDTSRKSQSVEDIEIHTTFRPTRNTMERGRVDSRFRTNADSKRAREDYASIIREKSQSTDQPSTTTWPYLFYTLQGVYLCSLLVHILSEDDSKKARYSSWWPAKSRSLVKAD